MLSGVEALAVCNIFTVLTVFDFAQTDILLFLHLPFPPSSFSSLHYHPGFCFNVGVRCNSSCMIGKR